MANRLAGVLFDVGGVRVGFEICEDAWVAERRGAELALEGADLILNPSASHFAFGKHAVRERLVLEGSRLKGIVTSMDVVRAVATGESR